jgi:putative ABC transport system permease protein
MRFARPRRMSTHSVFNAVTELARDMRFAVRSLLRVKGLAATIIVTLGLGIGANAAVFSVVRGVLLRPLVNRDEDRLIYIRQTAPGIDIDNYTFSMPEVGDIKARVKTVAAFGDFSTADLALSGVGGDPRMVKAGVVNGSFFEVMGLRPVLGRLLNAQDEGPNAAAAAVLTYRFWKTGFNSDPTVVGKTIRLGVGPATIVGVLEPAVPYPTDTEIISNLVTSPHHLGATMVTRRDHRMTDLFGRLTPGASIEAARAELTAVHRAIVDEHPEAYSKGANVQLRVARLRDQIVAPARTILLVLLATAAIVFVIATSNVANLILARSVRREGELALRAALGASSGALRRTLLAESLVLCAAGAVAGLYLADPLVTLVAGYAARFSVRALDVTVDSSVAWVGAALAIAAAVLLAFVPRLPSSNTSSGLGVASSGVRVTSGTKRRLQMFATIQIAFSFVLLVGAGMVLNTLVALQTGRTGYEMSHVLAFDVPLAAPGVSTGGFQKMLDFYDEAMRRVASLPGVDAVAAGTVVPWRDAGDTGPRLNFAFTAEGYTPADGEEAPRARARFVTPRFFSVLGIPLVAGREFTDADRGGAEPVAIVSQSIAQRFFPNGDALNRHLKWTDPKEVPWRIVGVAADVDDEQVVGKPAMTFYRPLRQFGFAGRLFVRAAGDPHSLVPSVTRAIHEIAADQPVERAATLEEVRAEVLSPQRVNAFVFSDRASRRGRRARIPGQRADPRVRDAAGGRLSSPAAAHTRADRRYDDCRDRDRRRRAGRPRAVARSGHFLHGGSAPWRAGCRRGCRRAPGGRGGGLVDACGARGADRRHRSVAIGVDDDAVILRRGLACGAAEPREPVLDESNDRDGEAALGFDQMLGFALPATPPLRTS